MKEYKTELETKCTGNTYEGNSFNCNAYDSGYCYVLGRALTEEEDALCEDHCILCKIEREN